PQLLHFLFHLPYSLAWSRGGLQRRNSTLCATIPLSLIAIILNRIEPSSSGGQSLQDFAHFALRIATAGLFLTGFPRVLSIQEATAQTLVPDGATSGRIREVPLPSGGNQRVLYARPSSPRGAIVMLPGGTGDVGIGDEGGVSHGNNFVVRTQRLW